jgi:hypothetical protein
MSEVEPQEAEAAPKPLSQSLLEAAKPYILHAVQQVVNDGKNVVVVHGTPDCMDGSHFMLTLSVDPESSQKVIDVLHGIAGE